MDFMKLLHFFSFRFLNVFFFDTSDIDCAFVISYKFYTKRNALYFNRDKRRLSLPVAKGFGYLIRYHMGTVAFGALIIGIVRLIRAMISFVQNTLKRYDNGFVKGILWCCQCCLWCFECALKFLTRNAYIETGNYNISNSMT